MTDDDRPEVSPRDAVEIAQRALAKANEIERDFQELQEDYEDVVEDLTAVQLRLSEIDDDRSYDAYTLDEKIGMVREHAYRKASDGHGKATLDYDDVMWEAFDGEPGAAHCYKLMRLAGEARGFTYADDASPKQLRVDATEAKRGAAFFAENKTGSEEGSP